MDGSGPASVTNKPAKMNSRNRLADQPFPLWEGFGGMVEVQFVDCLDPFPPTPTLPHRGGGDLLTTNKRLKKHISALLLLIVLFGWIGSALAVDKAMVRDLVVANSSRDLLLYFQVGEIFRPDMEEGVLNGIPASLTFLVSLRELKDGQPGRVLTELTINHTLSYDALREAFRLNLSETPGIQSCASLARARKMLTEVNGARVTALDNLRPGGEYDLGVKVRLEGKSLPLSINYLAPFWKTGEHESDWYHVQFRY